MICVILNLNVGWEVGVGWRVEYLNEGYIIRKYGSFGNEMDVFGDKERGNKRSFGFEVGDKNGSLIDIDVVF